MPDRLTINFGSIPRIILLSLILFSGNRLLSLAQEASTPEDTIIIEAAETEEAKDTLTKDPGKAALLSAAFPGLGQIYNQRYWKLPIIYAGFGTLGYFIDRNTRYYKDLKNKLLDPDYELKYFEGNFTDDQLTRGKDLYKRWRDLSIIGAAGFYVFQIIDATVDAYLFDWDVGEDISLRIEPSAHPSLNPIMPSNSFGLSACLSF